MLPGCVSGIVLLPGHVSAESLRSSLLLSAQSMLRYVLLSPGLPLALGLRVLLLTLTTKLSPDEA